MLQDCSHAQRMQRRGSVQKSGISSNELRILSLSLYPAPPHMLALSLSLKSINKSFKIHVENGLKLPPWTANIAVHLPKCHVLLWALYIHRFIRTKTCKLSILQIMKLRLRKTKYSPLPPKPRTIHPFKVYSPFFSIYSQSCAALTIF